MLTPKFLEQDYFALPKVQDGLMRLSQAQFEALHIELDHMRRDLRFAIRTATAVEAEAALEPIKLDLARAAAANAETTFTVRPDRGNPCPA